MSLANFGCLESLRWLFFVSSDTVSYPDGTSRKFEDTEVVVLSLEDSRGRFFTPNFSGDHFFLTISR